MNAKHVVKTFFESDFYKDTSILEKTLHEDFELYWNSSSGYFKLNKETFTQMLLEMSKSFEFLRQLSVFVSSENLTLVKSTEYG